MDSWPSARVPSLPGQAPEAVIWDTPTGGYAQAAQGREATIYACGITPYDATHIGHAATYIAWDLLIRAWRDAGHAVRYIQNVTDVDDPLLERAARDAEDWRLLADREIDRYRADMAALRVLPPDALVGAVEALGVIDEFSGTLADRGSLYDIDGDVYFLRSADPEFGSVSGYDAATMLSLAAERGGDPGRPGKKDPLDPLVWLARRPGEPSWGSRFGPGRPGWHVECAAIATRYLGQAFDVQAGGSDLIFPHHEMSASHARVAYGTGGGGAFARRYAHAGMVRLDGEKMSKSLGNLVFVSALREAGIDPMAVRLAILAHHYRQDWDWTDDCLSDAAERLGRWRAAVTAASSGGRDGAWWAAAGSGAAGRASAGLGAAGRVPAGEYVLDGVRAEMADDLNAPGALAVVDSWAHAVLGTSAGRQPWAAEGAGDAGDLGLVRDAAEGRAGSAALVRDTVDALLGVQL
ncbi:MAG TPA: cysteine--1-D-myo-inosityl 2-amino-2-deoxy-alpha-D-glucopyranoside ligase [Streptosporangiaceae bacterium]|nr:cysteine--1-D-myo-inosityl 2-amino-2-deoxy-alpha-D-glucopyranoside ligase [Streptosporangiaceae bacterium]